MTMYVLVYRATDVNNAPIVKVWGNRWGEPFTSEANAQRSLTRRAKPADIDKWSIKRIMS